MTSLPSWTGDCLSPLSGLLFLGRASRFSPERAAVLRKEELEWALTKASGAERGRLLRLLGRPAGPSGSTAAALAYRWEAAAGAEPRDTRLLDEAIEAEPENALWRTWRAIGRAKRRPRAAALDAAAALELGGPAPLPLLAQAWLAWQGKRLDEAEEAASRALTLDPSIEWAWRLRARIRKAAGRAEEAVDDCLEALRRDEYLHVFDALLPRPLSALEPRAALKQLDALIAREKDPWWTLALRADFRRSPGVDDHVGALADMQRCVERRPEAWALAYLTRCQVAVGDREAAAASIERAAALAPGSGWILAWKGEQQRRAGRAEEALRTLDEAQRLGPDYEFTYAWRGAALRQLGRAREALGDLGKAIALRPPYVEQSHFERMRALRDLGRTAEALADLEAAHAVNAKYAWETEPARMPAALRELEKVPAARRWRGELLLGLRRFAEAERALKDARNAAELVLRGRARAEQGRWAEALADFDRARRREPGNALAAAWRGRARVARGKPRSGLADLRQACALDRGAVWMLAWKAAAEHKLGRHKEALASADAALALHPRYAEAMVWRGAALCRLGRAAEGWAELDKAPHALERLGEEELAALRRLRPGAKPEVEDAAERALREGRHEEAAALLGELLKARPGDQALLRKRIEAWRCCGRYAEMIADCERLERSPAALCLRGEAKRHAWDFKGAAADAREALALDGRNAGSWALLSEAERGLGRLAEAEQAAKRAVEADQSWTWAHVVLAKALRQAGRVEDAEGPLAFAAKKGDAYALAWRADLRRKAGRPAEALRDAKAAVAAQPSVAWFRALRGELLRDLGRPAEAWADMEAAVRLDGRCSCDYDFLGAEPPEVSGDPQRAWVFAWRGAIHRRDGRLEQARRDLDRAVALDPRCFWALAWRGELALHEGDAAGALKRLESALKEHPSFVPALLWAGKAQLQLGRASAALERYRKAQAAAPKEPWAHIGLGASLEALGRAGEAARAFERAKKLAPALFEGVK